MLSGLAVLVGCRSAESPPPTAPFLNANASTEYVGDAACFDCHENQYVGYQSHGMANSLYEMDSEQVVEAFPGEAIFHEPTGLYYRAIRQGDRFFQEEYALGSSGQVEHRLVREMKYVMGSGTAARTYLTESDGRLYEMPLTWYTQSGHWNFSPGYATQPLRFDRLVPDRCMACHNSYPESVPHVTGKFLSVPLGIGCERCHGPGALHVEARLANPESAGDVDSTIVNPAHLSLDLKLDVCQQCHLHGDVSILRAGRGPFDFRPSQSLAGFMALFTSGSASKDEIRVISHADRMKQSPCFLETQDSAAPLTCTTCHDPHQGFRELGPDYFNETCISCHSLKPLQAAVADPLVAEHQAGANCFSCHMPRVEAEDAPHASFTDHFIRVVKDVPSPPAEESGNELIAYFGRDREGAEATMYQGIAYVVHGRQQGSVTTVEKGINLLRTALAQVQDSTGYGHFNLGLALQKIGRIDEAQGPLEESVKRNPDDPERLNALAQAYEGTGRSPQTIERLYRHALEVQPAAAEIRVNLGRFLESQNRFDEAMQAYRDAADEQPWLPTAHFNIGTLHLRQGELAEAVAELQEAVSLDPAYVEARGNLALAYLRLDDPASARRQFELAVKHAPAHPIALANLGAFYLNEGRIREAVEPLEKAVRADPTYATALANLSLAYVNLDRPAEARTYAQQALRVDPSNETARRVLMAVGR